MVRINTERCLGCGSCVQNCPTGALTLFRKKARSNTNKCIGCEICISACPQGAIEIVILTEIDELRMKMQSLRKRTRQLSQELDRFSQMKDRERKQNL